MVPTSTSARNIFFGGGWRRCVIMKAGAGPEAAAANAKSLRKQLRRHHSCRPIPPPHHHHLAPHLPHTPLPPAPPPPTHPPLFFFCSPSQGFGKRRAHGLGVLSFSRQNQSRRREGREGLWVTGGQDVCQSERKPKDYPGAETQITASWWHVKTAGKETPKSQQQHRLPRGRGRCQSRLKTTIKQT